MIIRAATGKTRATTGSAGFEQLRRQPERPELPRSTDRLLTNCGCTLGNQHGNPSDGALGLLRVTVDDSHTY